MCNKGGCLLSYLLLTMLVISAAHADELSTDHTQWPPEVFRSAYRLIASADEWHNLDTLPPDLRSRYLDMFWKRRDPTPTTEPNEFRRQFEERVDYAMTRFSVHAQPEPWDRRGEVFIRYGPPDERIDSSFDAYYEKWYYFSQNLRFMFEGGAEGQRLIPFWEFSGEVQSLPDFQDDRIQMQEAGVVYQPPRGERVFEVALAWYPFRRTDGQYDVYVACAAPMRDVSQRSRREGTRIDYVARVMAFDSLLQTTWSDSARVMRLYPGLPEEAMAQSQWTAVLPPGYYVVAAEVDCERTDKRAVTSFDRWLVPYDQEADLDLSPLVIAAVVRDAGGTPGAFVRNGKEIIPMAGHVFRGHQDVAFYHEVYNLQPAPDGQCHYRIEYALYDPDHQQGHTLISQEYTSAHTETFQAGRIPYDRIDKGKYILEVETTDLVAGISKTALAHLEVE